MTATRSSPVAGTIGTRDEGVEAAARAIGVVSLGFAVVSLAAPRLLARTLGYGDRAGLVRAMGARDLVVGLGLTLADDPRPWLRARLLSEAADTLLHVAGAATGAFAPRRAAGLTAVAASAGAVEYALLARSARPVPHSRLELR